MTFRMSKEKNKITKIWKQYHERTYKDKHPTNPRFKMSKEEKINYVHCVFQELETLNISLPMGDYDLMYSYLEEIREFFICNEGG